MKTINRTAAAAFAAAVALGISTPAALADPGHGHGHGTHGSGGQTGQGGKFAHDQKHALQEIARLDRQISKALDDSRLRRLVPVNGVDVKAAVLANGAADHAALADLATTVQAAAPGFDFRALRDQLRSVRPENYRVVVDVLRRAARIDAAADAAGATDVSAAVDAAVAQALAITATSSRSDLHAVVAGISDAEDEQEGTDDTGTDDPGTDDPGTDDPGTDDGDA
jgi:hypothetical protein